MLTVEQIAKIIQAEAGMLSYEGKLAVAQCVIDNDFNASAFTKPATWASEECMQAAQDALDGKRRFPDHKLLQFRSFRKYSNGSGEPDWDKIYGGKYPIPRDYLYLGKDGIEPLGHFYFGVLDEAQPNHELRLTVIYDGEDGLNVRSTPEFIGGNIVGVIYKGGEYTVVEKSENGRFWKLKSGVYVSADPLFTRVYEGKLTNYTVRVKIRDLNIRKGHGTNYANYGEPIPRGTYTIVEECSGLGSKKGWGLLKAYANDRNGWISLDFVEKVW